MTTFQDPPFQSRRSVRQSEREEVSLTESAGPEAPLDLPSTPPTGRRARTGEVPTGDATPVVDVPAPTEPPSLIEPPPVVEPRSFLSAPRVDPRPEPLDYSTRGGPQVPSYDGPSFSNNPNPASRQSDEPQFRVRDFSPEARRAAMRNTEAPQAWSPPEGSPVPLPSALDYHTQAGPPAVVPVPDAASEPETPDTPVDDAVESDAVENDALENDAVENDAVENDALVVDAPADSQSDLPADVPGDPHDETPADVHAPHDDAPAAADVEAPAPAVEPVATFARAADNDTPFEPTMTRRELRALRAQEEAERLDSAAAPEGEPAADASPDVPSADVPSADVTPDLPAAEATPAVSPLDADAYAARLAAASTPTVAFSVLPLVEPAAASETGNALASAIAEFESLARSAQQKSALESFAAGMQPDAAPAGAPTYDLDADPEPAEAAEGALSSSDSIPTADGLADLFSQPQTEPETAAVSASAAEPAGVEEPTAFDFLLKPTSPVPAPIASPPPFQLVPETNLAPETDSSVDEPAPAADDAVGETPAVNVPEAPATAFPEGLVAAFPTPLVPPAAAAADELTPQFVSPDLTTTGQSYATSTGHWSNQADLDDESQDFENTLSRDLGRANPTTNALVLPITSQHTDFAASLNATGEILATGSINLPEGFGSRGGDSRRYDDPDVDHLFDAFDNEVISTDSAPVRAIRSVSTQTATRGVIHSNKPNGNRMLTVLLVAGCVMAVAVGALLVAGIVFNIF